MGTHLRVLSESLIQWIPTQHGLDGFQKSLCPCALDESSLSIGRVNRLASHTSSDKFENSLKEHKIFQKILRKDLPYRGKHNIQSNMSSIRFWFLEYCKNNWVIRAGWHETVLHHEDCISIKGECLWWVYNKELPPSRNPPGLARNKILIAHTCLCKGLVPNLILSNTVSRW